ncbi:MULTISPECIES: quorum-sensing phosphorelay protein LuxU [unclassified Vibrio]|uniref:quorum-sensing phosphorelay protein LuxU n=1 Tax=unclassified Vibrio TaxID=2614977 RepID=UPI001929B53C|nr:MULTISPECIES: quorum-sensing phosphorelay protein LuxU [unclassified Vibrio]
MMEVLNQNKIEQLANDIGEENVPVLLGIFLGELESYIAYLSDPAAADKLSYLREISHALKSSAASFGAEQLCCSAIEIDARVKNGQPLSEAGDVSHMVELLGTTLSRYQQLV